MKTIYYCECDSNNSIGMDLVYWLNEKFMATFTKRKEAHQWLVERVRYLKERCANDIKRIKKYDKQFNIDTTITFDLYKAIVDDDFNIDVDNMWNTNCEYELIEMRYLVGRY